MLSAARTTVAAGPGRGHTSTSGERSEVIPFKLGKGRMEHVPARHNDDIQPGLRLENRSGLVTSEQLARPALCEIPIGCVSELPRRGDPQSRMRPSVWNHENRHETRVNPCSLSVCAFKFRAAADSFRGDEAAVHRSAFVCDRQAFSPLCATALQHDPPVLRRHPNSETVRLLTTPGVGLKRPFSLHGVLRVETRSSLAETKSQY